MNKLINKLKEEVGYYGGDPLRVLVNLVVIVIVVAVLFWVLSHLFAA